MQGRGGELQNIKALLQQRIGDLVRELVPDGKLNCGYWIGTNPARSDKRPGSFWIVVDRAGKTAGAWRDEAVYPGPGGAGDVIGLVQLCTGSDVSGALKWARRWLNYEALPQTTVNRAHLDQVAKQKKAAQMRVDLAEDEARRAFGLWLEAKYEDREKKRPRDFAKTLGAKYLAGRGLDVRALVRVPGCLGHLPRAKHIGAGGVVTWWPAMVAGMSDDAGHIRAVHRTFLAGDGSGKAPVDPVRKIWPSFAGLAIRLWRGETDMSVADAEKQGLVDTLVICEGVEDGLSIALARPDLRVWAAGALANLGNIKIPACAERVIVAADNDWGKPAAEAALKRGLAAIAAQGVPVFVARSTLGKDMNDLLRGAA